MSLADVLANAPAEAAVHVGDASISRADLRRAADDIADQLRSVGVAAGNVVAVRLPNGSALIAALFGVWALDAVYAPLNPRATAAEVEANLDALRPAAIVTARADGAWQVEPGASDAAVHEPGIALLQFTSGTTGRPKPVPLRHATVLDLIDRVVDTLTSSSRGGGVRADRPPMPNLVPVSLSLWAGIYQVLFAFRVGAPVVLMERFETGPFAELVGRFGIRSTVLPPAAMAMLADDEAITDLAPLRIVRSITAPLSPVQARRFHARFGVVVLNGYGQTELGGEVIGWSAADAREHGDQKLGSVGRAHMGVAVRIDDAGEILVRTPATAAREIDPGFHDRLTDDGWFHTGDLGSVDDDGFVWIEGRVSDMINRGGLKVFPAQVEEVLIAADQVRDAAVVGMPDDRLGEVPWAFVVTTDGTVDEAALLAWCRERLTAYKVPARVIAVDALPRNEIGKVLRRELVERAGS
ncbi:MAG: long-chain acyl-CoA synthetase [Acidimicrobiaceae bacterium]